MSTIDIFDVGGRIKDVTDVAKDVEKQTFETIKQTESDIFSTAQNGLYTGRFLAKNMIGLVDNLQDNLFNYLNSSTVDIASTIQLMTIIGVSTFIVVMLLYGDNIFGSGNISLF